MRYWKIVIYTTGGKYETYEFYINEPAFRQYQKAIIEDKEFIVMRDRVIKRTMIKEIVPAYKEIKEYLEMGVSLKTLGLPENPRLNAPQKNEQLVSIREAIIEKTKMFSPKEQTEIDEQTAKEIRKG